MQVVPSQGSSADAGGKERHAAAGDAGSAQQRAPLQVFLVEDSPIIRERLTESLSTPGRVEVIGYADTEHGAIAALRSAGLGTCWCSICSSSRARASGC